MNTTGDNRTDKAVLYGIRPFIEAIKSGVVLDKVFIKKGLRGEQVPELMGLLKKNAIVYSLVPEEKLDRLTRENHQGVFAFISPIDFPDLEAIVQKSIDENKKTLVLILDHITDVRNFGAIARTAECCGATCIVIPSDGTAPISQDAIKTSAGALFRIPVCKVVNLTDAILLLKQMGIKIVSATEKTDNVVYCQDLDAPIAIIMGNEEKGISNQLLKNSDLRVKLPLKGDIGSLNVSVACGAILYEIIRQQSFK